MFVVGLICLLLGWFLAIHFLVVLGIILMIVGAVLYVAASVGHPVGGRHWY